VQTSDFGIAVPLLYGTNRQPGNIIDYQDFTATAQQSSTGGKGGLLKGGSVTSYDYHVAVSIGLGQGPVYGIGRVWGGTNTTQLSQYLPTWSPDQETANMIQSLYWYNDSAGLNGLTWLQQNPAYFSASSSALQSALSAAGYSAVSLETDLTAFFGTLTQAPWGYMVSNHPTHALNYPLIAYVSGYIDLGDSPSVTSYSFEIFGNYIFGSGILDANPTLVLTDILTNPVGGCRFPSAYLGNLSYFSNYCVANGIFISPTIVNQTQASEVVNNIMQCTNSQPVVSQGLLTFVPYGTQTATGNGVTFTPNITPIYDLNDNDFLFNDKTDPVQVVHDVEITDLFNFLQVTFSNRNDEYANDVATEIDQGSIDNLGQLIAPSVDLSSYICDAGVAAIAAQNILQRMVYHANQATFKLPYFPFILLDPMDIVAITDPALGYSNTLVRIISIEGDDKKELTFTVEEVGLNASDAVVYPRQSATRSTTNYQVSPGNVNQPVIFEPPDALAGGLVAWIGASGGSNWGGCYVYLSNDGNSYMQIGEINSPARQGVLSAALPVGSDPDTTDTLSVNMAMSAAQLNSGTQADADSDITLCYCDGELISYEMAALTGTDEYNLTYLRRGCYGTPIAAHNPNTQFMRVDESRLFAYDFAPTNIGQTIYLKFMSFNIYNGGYQDLSTLPAYQYTLQGTALYSSLPNVTNLKLNYSNGYAVLSWSAISDFRTPIQYEIRQGTTWSTAQMVGRVTATSFTLPGYGNYFVAAVYPAVYNSKPYYVYSATPENIEGGARVPLNTIATYDELATGWSGTLSGVGIKNNAIQLIGQYDWDSVADNDNSLWDVDMYDYAVSTGTYTIPSSHIVVLSAAQLCNVSYAMQVEGIPIVSDFDSTQDTDSVADWDGNNSQYITATPQINVYNGTAWSGWQTLSTGQYYGQQFNFQVVLATSNAQFTPALADFSYSIDVVDNVESANVSIPAAGCSVLYPTIFNMVPTPVITIFNAQAGDTVILSNQTSSGFTVQIQNSGVGVARNINYAASGY
jgi:hypothetical protein